MDDRIERLQRDACRSGVICLGGGLPNDALFPRKTLCESFVEAVRGPAALQYGWPEGSEPLRRWIAERLRNRGADVTAADVVVTSGAQQAIALAIDALGPSKIRVDEETYPAALDLFRSRGIAAGPSGDAIYAMPGVDNPRGRGLRGRSSLLATGAPILADEAYSELRFDGLLERPLLADARDRVFHIGTVSKTLCPGLRVGWLVPPREHLASVLRFKHDVDLQAGSLSQAVLESFLARDDFDARLARARKFYVTRAKRMTRALARIPGVRFSMPEGGFAIFVETDLEGDDRRLLEIATECGVSFDPGRLFRADDRSSPIAFRLCFSNVSTSEIDEGIRRLASAMQRFRSLRAAA
jgi:2-aminoadipate transaminase